jgi:uncharacterized membrane protein (DUF2068 family)
MEKPQEKERPLLISILCCLGFLGVISSPLTITKPWVRAVGRGYQVYLVAHYAVMLAAFIGMWKMKRWGVYLFILAATVGQIVLAMIGHWGVLAAVLYGVFIAAVLYYLPRMD